MLCGEFMSPVTSKPCERPAVFAQFKQSVAFLRQIFIKVRNIAFYGNPSSGSRVDTHREDRRANMTFIIGAFRDYANALKISLLV
jgi:hypothetical protein